MSNNFIKKNIWVVIFSCQFVTMLIAKVNPEPGENLWRLTARIGECIDAESTTLDFLESKNDLICSKLEKLDADLISHSDIVCSKLEIINSVIDSVSGIDVICSKIENIDENLSVHDASICSKLEQIDAMQNVLLSAVDTIDAVGPCETLIFQSNIPYIIENPGVYCLAESVSLASGTAITVASDNVVLDLNEKKIDGGAGGSIGIAVNSGLQNITIQNGTLCNMNDKGINADATNNIAFVSMSVLDSLIDMPSLIAPITCLQINNVNVLNVGIFKEFPISSIVDSIIDVPDCVLSSITGININCANEVKLNNCQACSCLGDGFALQQSENITVLSCNAENNAGNGFVLDNVDTSCFKWCKANVNCFHGVCDSACNGDNLYVGCIAKQNGIHGFNIAGGGKVMQECVASQNTRDGFNLSTSLFFDGDLDNTFGSGGKVITNFGGNIDTFTAVVIQKDGKVVAVGRSNTGGMRDFVLARYNADGSLDNTWGIGGLVTTDFGSDDNSANTVVIQKDGKIVAAGFANVNGENDFALARYNTDGSLDVTFNLTGSLPGTVTTDFGSDSRVNGVAIQKNGKIVTAGTANVSGTLDFALARYNIDGSLDVTFNLTGSLPGTVTTNFGGPDAAKAVAIQKDGKIVVVGRSDTDFALARYNIDGSLDVTFNPTGVLPGTVTTDFGGNTDVACGIAIQKDGKIVAVGSANVGGTLDFALARYNIDGSLDVTFNPTGVLPGTVTTDFGDFEFATGVVIQKDGKIVAVGLSNVNGEDDFALARYNTDGSLDSTFGIGGLVVTDFSGSDDGAEAVAIQKDGKIVAVGESENVGGTFDFALARYVVLKRGVAVRDCVAEENGEDGFNIVGNFYEVKDSAAIHNAADGFLLESLSDSCQLMSNEALQNNNIGIENLGTMNQVFNNRALNNASGNYSGVSLVTTPTLTTSYWANVES
ncbi:MAG: hypothetical protein WCD44_04210 [Candidatus Babeliales bacterium]